MAGRIALGFAVTLIALLSFAIVIPSFATSASSTEFVAYNITVTSSSTTFSAVINETLSSSDTVGLSDLTLQFVSSMNNLTYSKLVNSSLALLPYLPDTGNNSFSYHFNNYSISASITKIGSSIVTISGSSYTTTDYSFQLSASKLGENPISVSGQLSTLPSGLVYSAAMNTNGYYVQAQLSTTNLSLSTSSSASSTSAAVLIAGGFGTLVASLGAFALYKKENVSDRNEPKHEEEERKPLYHVD